MIQPLKKELLANLAKYKPALLRQSAADGIISFTFFYWYSVESLLVVVECLGGVA